MNHDTSGKVDNVPPHALIDYFSWCSLGRSPASMMLPCNGKFPYAQEILEFPDLGIYRSSWSMIPQSGVNTRLSCNTQLSINHIGIGSGDMDWVTTFPRWETWNPCVPRTNNVSKGRSQHITVSALVHHTVPYVRLSRCPTFDPTAVICGDHHWPHIWC